jgi:parallel beta helix pectate lyase-like protein
MKVATSIALLMLSAAFSPFASAAGWCTKDTTLKGLAERFPSNHGPDIVVRVDLGQSIQTAIDTATDVNGDGYIIVAAVNSGSGAPYGTTAQRIVIDRAYPLPFGLFGCSLSLRDPAPVDERPTAHITLSAAAPDLFVMDLHATGSSVVGWLVEGNGRYLRNAYAKNNAVGYWFSGDGNTLHNGTAEANSGIGILVDGDGNTVKDTRVMANGGHGIMVTGDSNSLLKNLVGDRGNGNGGTGIAVTGAGTLVQENKVHGNAGDGIEVTGGTAASPNVIKLNAAGDKARGNGGNGIHVHDDVGNGTPNAVEVERNTVRSNALNGIFIAAGATGHELKGNVSGDTSPELNNGDCEFLVADGNLNATGNKANGVTIPGADGSTFPTSCIGSP